MKYSNEIKVGATIIAAAIVFFLGLRYFQDIPVFQQGYVLKARFQEAGGLVSGNPVQINGVSVGRVEEVALEPETQSVEVRFRMDGDVPVPEGSQARISGLSTFGGVRLVIAPGPSSNPRLTAGSFVPSPPSDDLLDRLSDQAPVLASKADTLLTSANSTLAATTRLIGNPNSPLNRTLEDVNETAAVIRQLARAERGRISRVLQNLEQISSDLESFTSENSDSLGTTVTRLNQTLDRANRNLATLERTTQNLDQVVAKINNGEGTLGRLANDPSLYMRLDSAAVRVNSILREFENDPSRYLQDMTLVRVF
jgi:phospholipid/cholesterol/gamma-HCH transport system substrate-binding protein